jgi:hypothetical protein
MSDPLFDTQEAKTREAFSKASQELTGLGYDQVAQVGLNLLVNGLRQQHGSWSKAEAAYDEYIAKVKGTLRDHYDHNGKRKPTFAFTQVLGCPRIDFRPSKDGSY